MTTVTTNVAIGHRTVPGIFKSYVECVNMATVRNSHYCCTKSPHSCAWYSALSVHV